MGSVVEIGARELDRKSDEYEYASYRCTPDQQEEPDEDQGETGKHHRECSLVAQNLRHEQTIVGLKVNRPGRRSGVGPGCLLSSTCCSGTRLLPSACEMSRPAGLDGASPDAR